MPTLTRDVRDRAVAALRQAHTEGRPLRVGKPWSYYGPGDNIDEDIPADAVCSCVVIAEAFGMPEAASPGDIRTIGITRRNDAIEDLYTALDRVGIPSGIVYITNDSRRSFDVVADRLALIDVVDAAEAICRDAAELVPA